MERNTKPKNLSPSERYRYDALLSNKNSKDYAGTANVSDYQQKEKMKITYRKGLTGEFGLRREFDGPLAEVRHDQWGGSTTLYHTYDFDQETNGKEGLGSTTDGALVDAHYSFLFPKIMFLRGVCFGERVDENTLRGIIEEATVTKYERPVNIKSSVELKTGDLLGLIGSSFQNSRLNLASLHSGDYHVARLQTPKDKIDEILLKQEFEGLMPFGNYRVGKYPIELSYDSLGTLIKIGYGDSHLIKAVGGVQALAFLAMTAKEKPEEITDRFASHSEFKSGVKAKIEDENRLARYLSETKRFTENFDHYSEEKTYWQKLLLDTTKKLLR
jgi:hypothetical protein